jgi:hypothetical protein
MLRPFCHQPSYRTAQPLPMLPSTPSLVPLSASAALHALPPDAAFSAAAERRRKSSPSVARQIERAYVTKLAACSCQGGQKQLARAAHVAPCLHPAPTKLPSGVPRFAQVAPCPLQVVKPSTMLKEYKSRMNSDRICVRMCSIFLPCAPRSLAQLELLGTLQHNPCSSAS